MKRGRPYGATDSYKRPRQNYKGRQSGATDKTPRGGYGYFLSEQLKKLHDWERTKQVKLVPRNYNNLDDYVQSLNMLDDIKPCYWRYKYLCQLANSLRNPESRKRYRPRFWKDAKRQTTCAVHKEKILKRAIEEISQIEEKIREANKNNSQGANINNSG